MKIVTSALCLALLLTVTGCGGSQIPDKAKQVAYECATVDIGRTIPEIGMTIFQDAMALIQAGTAGWQDKLIEIGVKYGEDSLACAAKAAYDALTAHAPGVQAAPPSQAALRARTFIENRSYRYQ